VCVFVMCMQESHTHTYTHTSNSSRLSERKLILIRALMRSTSPPSARASTRGKPSTSMFDSGGNRISLSSGYCDKALRRAHVSGLVTKVLGSAYLQGNH